MERHDISRRYPREYIRECVLMAQVASRFTFSRCKTTAWVCGLWNVPPRRFCRFRVRPCRVYQTYINMMNEHIRQQMDVANPFKFHHITNLKSIDQFDDSGPSVSVCRKKDTAQDLRNSCLNSKRGRGKVVLSGRWSPAPNPFLPKCRARIETVAA